MAEQLHLLQDPLLKGLELIEGQLLREPRGAYEVLEALDAVLDTRELAAEAAVAWLRPGFL